MNAASSTRRRTFTRQQLEESRAAWDAAGPWSSEWKDVRHLAAISAGIIFPPDGTRWDSWGDGHPSQRAILVRAIRETPDALNVAIRAARKPTWTAVIDLLLATRDRMAEGIEMARDIDAAERSHDVTHQQAKDTLRRIGVVLGRRSA